MTSIPPVGSFTISEIQKERGSVYGKFSEQAEFVGRMIHEFEMVAVHNDAIDFWSELIEDIEKGIK